MVGDLYVALRHACPADLEVLVAPLDITVSERTVLEPDLLVASRSTWGGRTIWHRGTVSDAQRRILFEELAREMVEPLRRFLSRRTDPDTAEDVLADSLLVCWRRWDEVPADDTLPWAYGVARHALANAERGRRRQTRLAGRIAVVDPPRTAAAYEPGPRDDEVHEALARLRPDDAELLRLWAWEQLTPAEIAVVLDSTANAVSIRLHRAKQKLADEIRKIEAVAGHEGS